MSWLFGGAASAPEPEPQRANALTALVATIPDPWPPMLRGGAAQSVEEAVAASNEIRGRLQAQSQAGRSDYLRREGALLRVCLGLSLGAAGRHEEAASEFRTALRMADTVRLPATPSLPSWGCVF